MAASTKPAARIVRRSLRYAWFELEDPRDGIAFDRAFSSAELGWRNIFLDLPPKPGKKGARQASNWPSLRIEWITSRDNPKEHGLLALPTDTAKDGMRVGEWVLNPGITGGKLVSEGADAQADLVVVSGHGASGSVFGDISGSQVDCDLSQAFRVNARAATRAVRVKYLFLPACYLASELHAAYWAPLFSRTPPFHGIFGYAGGYIGDKTGAGVMRRFAGLLKRVPRKPLLEAWREANGSLPWGAYQMADSRDDNLEDWVTRGLPTPGFANGFVHYSASSWPDGSKQGREMVPYEVRFVMADETEIRYPNNAASDRRVGLFPGERGAIVVRALTPGDVFRAGESFTIAFYYFRPDHKEGIAIEDLLDFAPSHASADFSLALQSNTNPYFATLADPFNGIVITPRRALSEIRIPYIIKSDASTKYKKDPNGETTHGRFGMILFPPGSSPGREHRQYDAYPDGAWLREHK